GLVGICGQPVTNHTYSQRVQEDYGGRVCGVTLGYEPTSFAFKHLDQAAASQRLSVLLYFKRLARPAPAVVHLPAHHRRMVERIYAHLETPLAFETAARPNRHGTTSVTYSKTQQYGTIHVERIGADTAADVRRARRDLVETAGC